MNIYLLLVFFFLLRLGLSALFPLTADESYYWLWSKHLALSYVDHPPLVAVINWLTTGGRENLFLLRLGPNILILLTSWLLYSLVKELYGKKLAWRSVLLFQILPHFLIIWLTMFVEVPLGFFWLLAIWLLNRAMRTEKIGWWLLVGTATGLGSLSKYTMFLFWPCLALYWLIVPTARHWLKRHEPYLAGLTNALFFSPVLIWNARNNWVSFTFHGEKTIGSPWLTNFLPFFGDQLVHFTPWLVFSLVSLLFFSKRKGEQEKFLAAFSLPVILLFFLASLKIKVWAHWPAVGYLTLIPLFLAQVEERQSSFKKTCSRLLIFLFLIISILFFVSPGVLLQQKGYANNYRLAEKVPQEIKFFTANNVSASLLEFYLKRPVYMVTGWLKPPQTMWGEKQYKLWGIPELQRGENIYYYGPDSTLFREKAEELFTKTTELAFQPVFIEDYISNNYKLFLLTGYKNEGGHP